MNEKYDVIETASQNGNFRLFVQALEATGLAETLKEAGPYTLLSPVDDAFLKLSPANLESLFKADRRDSLKLFLENHIVAGKLWSSDLKDQDTTITMKGEELRIDAEQGLWINEAQVISPDLEATNGVLHGLDAVLMPQTQLAAAN